MRSRFRTILLCAAACGLPLSACGDDDSSDGGSSPAASDGGVDATSDEAAGNANDTTPSDEEHGDDVDAPVTITVDGVVHQVTTVQTCETETDTQRETDVQVFGFTSEGPRIEFTMSYQGADTSPTGTDQYFARLNVSDVAVTTVADEPFDFLTDDRSTVHGTLTMETTPEPTEPVEVAVDITCP